MSVLVTNDDLVSLLTLPTYDKSVAADFKNVYLKTWKISIIVGIITGKKIVAKGEIAHLNQFIPLSQCYQKLFAGGKRLMFIE